MQLMLPPNSHNHVIEYTKIASNISAILIKSCKFFHFRAPRDVYGNIWFLCHIWKIVTICIQILISLLLSPSTCNVMLYMYMYMYTCYTFKNIWTFIYMYMCMVVKCPMASHLFFSCMYMYMYL